MAGCGASTAKVAAQPQPASGSGAFRGNDAAGVRVGGKGTGDTAKTRQGNTRPRNSTTEYNRDQKTLDEKVLEGKLNRMRREGVSSEAVAIEHRTTRMRSSSLQGGLDNMMTNGSSAKKDDATRRMLSGAIDKCILFSGFSEEQRSLIIDVMCEVPTEREDVIIRQGEALVGSSSDNFYVVGEGQFDIYIDSSLADRTSASSAPQPPPPAGGGTVELVQQRFVGDTFGEIALMYNCPRQATVMCTSDKGTLWALQRRAYREINQGEQIQSIESMVQTIKNVELLKDLNEQQFSKIVDSFDVLSYKTGDRIVKMGEVGSEFFIILKGSVNCVDGAGKVVAALSRCDYFGERSLLKDEPRALNVDAATSVTLARVTRETFAEVLGPLSKVMDHAFTSRVLLNVPLLSRLTPTERERLLDECRSVTFEPGEAIIRQGEVGDLFYIVREGTVNCFVNGKQVKQYMTAEYFGERALLRDEPRAADCIAATQVTCVTLQKESFEKLLGPLQAVLDYNIVKDTLRTAPLFRYLTSAERETVLNGFDYLDFTQGELIFRQGDPGVSFILIREGEVKTYSNGQEVGTKGEGDHLGEKSLLYGTPREFDAVVTSETCQCAFLDQQTFEECMGPIADVLKRATEVVNLEELEEHRVLGVGTFGKVKLVKDKSSGRIFAMKIISKQKVIMYNQKEHVMSEKSLLAEIDHPFCIQLMACFKDTQRLYMVLEYCPGGELFNLLQRERVLKDAHCVFYAASVMLAFEYMHELNIIYRDLKPENLLLDSRGYCKICDFGFAKRIVDRTWTLCGTPEYLAPETIRSKGHGKGVDWWALGVLIYEMAAGFPPYCGDSAMHTYKLILEGNLEFPKVVSSNCRDIVRRLLHPSVTKRLGCLRNGGTDVRLHRWFADMNMQMLLRMKVDVPFVPDIKHDTDTSNFPEYDDVPDEHYEDDGTGWDDDF